MARLNRFAAATALAAAFSMSAAPVMARDHHWHRWHRDRIDGGDVLAGALILGGIAAVASAASKADRSDRETSPPPAPVPNDRQSYTDGAADRDVGPDRDQGLDRAADLCAKAVDSERNQVDFVDSVSPDRDGWAVSGALVGGSGFSCHVGTDGQVADVNIGGPHDAAHDDDYSDNPPPAAHDEDNGPPDVQGDDDDAPPGVDNRPVWHGDEAQPQSQPEPQDDGRYDTSQAPDFGQSA